MYSEIKFFKNYFTKISDNFFILDNDDSYSVNFGKQWRDHRDIQIDSINKFSLSYDYLNKMLFSNIEILKNKEILEIGSGAGRFTEHLCQYADKCVSVDLSSSVFYNISKNKKNVVIIKSDFTKLISNKKFDIVFCRGVLQHTPDPIQSILKLHEFVKEDGYVFFDIYKLPKIGYLHPKYILWRPLIKTFVKYENFEKFLKKKIKILLKIKRIIRKIFFNSKFISDCFLPIWDYKNYYNLSDYNLEKWSILDTIDGIYAKYDYPQRNNKIINILQNNSIEIINNDKNIIIFQTKLKKN